MSELLKRFADAVEKLAFEMPAPNRYTPRLVQMCAEVRSQLATPAATQEAVGRRVAAAAELMADHCAAAMALAKRDRLLDTADAWVAADDEFNKLEMAFRDNLIAALAASGHAPTPGFVVVPREPTEAMLKAGGSHVANMVGDPYNAWQHFTGEAKRIWSSMIAASGHGNGGES